MAGENSGKMPELSLADEYMYFFDFIQFWLGAKAQPTHFSELTVVGHVYRVLINYFYRRVMMDENAHFKG